MGNSKGIVKIVFNHLNPQRIIFVNKISFKDVINIDSIIISKKSRKKERWKPIHYNDVADGMYFISSHGRVKNNRGKILSYNYDKDGYLKYTLQRSDHKHKMHLMAHRLVAYAFVKNPNPSEYDQVDHIDRDKTNNYYENLRWCNQLMNNRYNRKFGMFSQTVVSCEKHGKATMTDSEVIDICKKYEKGFTTKEILSDLGIHKKDDPVKYERYRSKLKMIRTHKSWKQISSHFDF